MRVFSTVHQIHLAIVAMATALMSLSFVESKSSTAVGTKNRERRLFVMFLLVVCSLSTGCSKTNSTTKTNTFSSFQAPADWSDSERVLLASMQNWDGNKEISSSAADNQRVLKELRFYADQGDPAASFLFGSLCLNGWLVPKSEVEGTRFLESASNAGNTLATHNLNSHVYFGTSDESLREASFKRLLENAEGGFAPSQFTVSQIYDLGLNREENATEAFRWAFRSFKSTPQSQIALIRLTSSAKKVTLSEKQKADVFELVKAMADDGQPAAMYSLGQFFEEGLCVEANPSKAIEWYRRAMEKKHAQAFASMGYLIERRSSQDFEDKKISMEELLKIKALYRGLYKQGVALGDDYSKLLLKMSMISAEFESKLQDYSHEAMMLRASEDALLDAAGLYRARR